MSWRRKKKEEENEEEDESGVLVRVWTAKSVNNAEADCGRGWQSSKNLRLYIKGFTALRWCPVRCAVWASERTPSFETFSPRTNNIVMDRDNASRIRRARKRVGLKVYKKMSKRTSRLSCCLAEVIVALDRRLAGRGWGLGSSFYLSVVTSLCLNTLARRNEDWKIRRRVERGGRVWLHVCCEGLIYVPWALFTFSAIRRYDGLLGSASLAVCCQALASRLLEKPDFCSTKFCFPCYIYLHLYMHTKTRYRSILSDNLTHW